MRSDPLRPRDRIGGLLYGMIVALTIGALAMIKGVQLMTLVWLLLFAKIAYEDVQTKSYPLYFGLVFMLSSLLLRMLSGEVESVLVDLLGGGAILGLSGMLKRHVGSGDTVVMLGMLIACGLRACGHTFFLAAVFGVILSCFTMNPEKQKEVAFIPLLFMGMMVYKLME